MITPAYGLTSTERVLPRLALDFTTGTLDSRITFTRALNTATRVNSSGYIESINADLPRFDYDPVTLAAKGLLIEEARTNNLLYSNAFDDPYYNATARATAVPSSAISPDGTNNAYKLEEDNTLASTHIVGRVTVANTQTAANYCASVFVKQAGRTQARLRLTDNATGEMSLYVNLLDGTVVSSGAGTWTNFAYGVQDYGDGWYRIWVAGTKPNATAQSGWAVYPAVGGSITYDGNGTDGIYIYGGSVEVGLFPTSYIPTTTTAVTRNADVATMTGTNFSDWFNATEGTFGCSFSTFTDSSSFRRILSANANTTANEIYIGASSSFSGRSFVVSSSSTQASFNYGAFTVNTPTTIALAYKTDSIAGAMNGGNPSTDALATIPTVDRLEIGTMTFAGLWLNGHIQKIQYWSQRLINAEVQAFSK